MHDLLRLEQTPRTFIMAACRSGSSDPCRGDELLGITPALIARGTTSVVGATTLVPDDHATIDYMRTLHGHLRAGAPPTEAVAAARAGSRSGDDHRDLLTAAAFTCFGS